jgi:hypothetical protein
LGLSWSNKIKPRKRTLSSFRNKAIRDYLTELDKTVCSIENGNPDGLVLVFMDESYCHNTHASDHSYLPDDNKHIGRSSSKGRRLIILHAITPYGPLCDTDDGDGKPVCDLKWNGTRVTRQNEMTEKSHVRLSASHKVHLEITMPI